MLHFQGLSQLLLQTFLGITKLTQKEGKHL